MILIDSSFLTSIGIVGSDDIDGNQYDFFHGLAMSNGTTVYNQYDFFLNSPVNGTYYNNQLEWYEAIGVLHSEPIYNQYTYFQNVTFDGTNAIGNQYDYYKGVGDIVSGIYTIVNTYGFYNAWGQLINVDGTDTTLIDYKGEHNLVNPTAANQLVKNTSDTDFNSSNSVEGNGTNDYALKGVPNYGSAWTSGTFVMVINNNSFTTENRYFGISDNATNNYKLFFTITTSGKLQIRYKDSATNTMVGTTVLSAGSSYVILWETSGTAWKWFINESEDTISVGTNNGNYLGDITPGTLDNISSMGSKQSSSNQFADGKSPFMGFCPYLSTADRNQLIVDLKTEFNIT